MKNKVLVKIYGRDYLLATDESQGYSDRLADILNDKLRRIMHEKSELSRLDGAMLVALEALDESQKNSKSIDNIRSQIKQYVDASDKAKADLARVQADSKQELDKKDKEIAALSDKCKKLEEEGRLAVQNASRIAAGTNLYMDKSNKQTEQIRELSTRLTASEGEKATLNAAMKRVENEKAVLDSAMRRLENEKKSLGEQNKALDAKNKELEAANKKLVSENTSLNDAIDKYEKGSSLFMDKADSLENENNTLKERIRQLERENAFLKEKAAQLEAEKRPANRVTLTPGAGQLNKGSK
ncbi:MAG: cell division protein ZapA [Ruminococcus sp.]|nr:cell division protein ZapA [Ruminococcus sp.]